jgi:hypothetical protein
LLIRTPVVGFLEYASIHKYTLPFIWVLIRDL